MHECHHSHSHWHHILIVSTITLIVIITTIVIIINIKARIENTRVLVTNLKPLMINKIIWKLKLVFTNNASAGKPKGSIFFSCAYACDWVRVFSVKTNYCTSTKKPTTFGCVWPIIALDPVSLLSEQFNKMAEAVTDFDENFSKVVHNYRILYDKELKDFDTNGVNSTNHCN